MAIRERIKYHIEFVTEELTSKHCEPCRGGVPSLSKADAKKMLSHVTGWQLREEKKALRLEKSFTFKDFVESMKFVNRVADIAEAEGHHPDLHIHWNMVRVELWTHKINGLHENDFILASKINSLPRGT